MLKPQDCIGCPLYNISSGFSVPEGAGTSGVVIVGEALGYDEFIDGLPFRPRAQAGSKLEEAFSLASTSRPNFKLYNTIQCQPPNNELVGMPYAPGAIAHCKVHRDREIGGFKTPFTKVILGLGNTPLKALTGLSGEAKNKESVTYLRGYVLKSEYGLYIPSLHPAFLRRGNPHLTPFLAADIRKALQVAKGEYRDYLGGPDYVAPKYQTHPSLDEAIAFYHRVKDNPNLLLAYDIETPLISGLDEDERALEGEIPINLIQFSLARREAIAFPYFGQFVDVAKAIMALPNIKANHNCWGFDNPILEAHGFKLNGRIHDTQWMFKTWHPTLERSLQKVSSLVYFPFPWKHLYGTQLEWYGCADVDAIQWIVARLPKLMVADGTWACYKSHVFDLYTNSLLPASKRGIPVSRERWTQLKADLEWRVAKAEAELNSLVPDSIRSLHPKAGYKREPKEITLLRENYISAATSLLSQGKKPSKTLPQLAQARFRLVRRAFLLEDGSTEVRWARLEAFKAGSSQQVIRYLRHQEENAPTVELAKAYSVPMTLPKRGAEARETTSGDELEWIAERTNDLALKLILDIRSLNTTLNNMLPNWEPGADGRVHTSWNFKPSTGQLATTGPNIQNASKHTEVGQEFRRIIEAPEAWEFSEVDYKTFHVAIMAWIADDPTYLRYARIDPHSIFASNIINDPSIPIVDLQHMTDEEIKAICKRIKASYAEVRQNVAKPAVLGNQLGLGYKRLHAQNKKYIKSEDAAKALQAQLARIFPKVEIAKEHLLELAHRQRELKNPWGRRQEFFEVYVNKFVPKFGGWKRLSGSDAEKALAFMVQSCAFGMIAEKILECERKGLNEKYGWINTIHDSSMFLRLVTDRVSFTKEVVPIYQAPCTWLKASCCPEGLSVNVEHLVGRNWQYYHEVNNPEGMREI
jgi:uracil-DNA glycosylase family 4